MNSATSGSELTEAESSDASAGRSSANPDSNVAMDGEPEAANGSDGTADGDGAVYPSARSAAASSPGVAYLSPALFEHIRDTTSARAGDTDELTVRTSATGSGESRNRSMSVGVAPPYGRRPARSSKRMIPRLYTSALGPTELESTACSGGMYAGVPSTVLAMVISESTSADTFATPRSSSLTVPSEAIMMFSGLRSRCTTP